MGKRKKKRSSSGAVVTKDFVAQKPVTPPYVIDEYGYIGTAEALEWKPVQPQSEQQTVKPTADISPTVKRDNLKDIPESEPAGFLDLSNLPVSKAPIAAVFQEKPTKQPQPTSNTQTDPMIECPFCAMMIRQSRLEGHQTKFHAVELAVLQATGPTAKAKLIAALRTWGLPGNNFQSVSIKDGETGEISAILTPADSKASNTRVECPICKVSVKLDQLGRHFRKAHQNAKTSSKPKTPKRVHAEDLVTCPVCNVAIKPERLAKHLLKVHKQENVDKRLPAKSKQRRKAPGKRGQSSQSSNTDRKNQDAFGQDSYESRFGDKYVGLSRRENGRFGSLPLYDDYGDDADAD